MLQNMMIDTEDNLEQGTCKRHDVRRTNPVWSISLQMTQRNAAWILLSQALN